MTAREGDRVRKLRLNSQASVMKYSFSPISSPRSSYGLYFMLGADFVATAPLWTVGFSPASRNISPIIAVVVDLPEVPATAIMFLYDLLTVAKSSERSITGMFSARAWRSSGLSCPIAPFITTHSLVRGRFLCPIWTGMPKASRALVWSLSPESEPLIVCPLSSNRTANADMEIPPIPMK